MKKWEPMRVTVVGKITEVVLDHGKQSGRDSDSANSFTFPTWWWPK